MTVDIRRLADQAEPGIRRLLTDALTALESQVSLNDVTDLIEAGATEALNELVGQIRFPDDVTASTQRLLTELLTRAAVETSGGIGLVFNIRNPAVTRWIEAHTGELITNITEETRQAVRSIVGLGYRDGIPVREQARQIRRIIGLTERDAGALTRFHNSLIEAGDTKLERVQALSDRMRTRMIRRRADLIARTESILAGNQGQLQAWRDAADVRLIVADQTRRMWIATEDERLCPTCAVLDGQTIAFDGTFTSSVQATGFDIQPAGTLNGTPQQDIRITGTKPLNTPIVTQTPPAHPGCRCSSGLVFV